MRSTALEASSVPAVRWSGEDAASGPLQVEQVYEAHFDFVWRSARRLGALDSHIDDVVQEVFVVVQRKLGDFQGRSELRTWLFGITRRIVSAHLRSQARRPRASIEDIGEPADVSTPNAETRLVAVEDNRLLYALLDELDSDKREVFVLSELEELSGPQIADALGLHLSNVYARVRGARQAFDAALKRHRARSQRAR
jgi:RNA polymerase sigma-70 factor, ECF subfamily